MLFITGPILGIGAFMHSALTNALVIQSAAPHLRGTTAGFVNLFNQIGVMLAPMILGSMLTATGSYQSALMTLAIDQLSVLLHCSLYVLNNVESIHTIGSSDCMETNKI